MYAGVGSGGRFRKVLEGSGKFRRVPVCAGVGRRVSEGCRPESSSVCWCRFRRVRKVPESSGVVCCLATLTGAAM